MTSRHLGRFGAWATWLPAFGIACATFLYFWAATLYPGGNPIDPHAEGYDHWMNYWCDLQREWSRSGVPNRGRPMALMATWILPLSLVPLWLAVPLLFARQRRLAAVVRTAGSAAMVSATAIGSPFHDVAINVSITLGFVALGGTLVGLDRQRNGLLLLSALPVAGLVFINYVLWLSQQFLWAIPAVQKTALLAVFGWVLLVCSMIQRATTGDAARVGS